MKCRCDWAVQRYACIYEKFVTVDSDVFYNIISMRGHYTTFISIECKFISYSVGSTSWWRHPRDLALRLLISFFFGSFWLPPSNMKMGCRNYDLVPQMRRPYWNLSTKGWAGWCLSTSAMPLRCESVWMLVNMQWLPDLHVARDAGLPESTNPLWWKHLGHLNSCNNLSYQLYLQCFCGQPIDPILHVRPLHELKRTVGKVSRPVMDISNSMYTLAIGCADCKFSHPASNCKSWNVKVIREQGEDFFSFPLRDHTGLPNCANYWA